MPTDECSSLPLIKETSLCSRWWLFQKTRTDQNAENMRLCGAHPNSSVYRTVPAPKAQGSLDKHFWGYPEESKHKVLISFLWLWKRTMTKSNTGRKGLIWLPWPDRGPSVNEAKAGTQADYEPRDRSCRRGHTGILLIGCSSWLTHPAFFYNPGSPSQAWHQSKLTGSSHINR